jgi:hypothetical protein
MRAAENRKLGINETDSDSVLKEKWQEIRELKSRILDQQLKYHHEHQQPWQSTDELKAIETAVYTGYYNNNKNKDNNNNTEQRQQITS